MRAAQKLEEHFIFKLEVSTRKILERNKKIETCRPRTERCCPLSALLNDVVSENSTDVNITASNNGRKRSSRQVMMENYIMLVSADVDKFRSTVWFWQRTI